MPFAATGMQLEIIILSEISQKEIPYDITYIWNLKQDTNESRYETPTDSQTQRTDLGLPKVGRQDGVGDWVQQMYAFIHRMDKQQGPTVQHRELYNCIQYPGINHNGKEYKKQCIHVYS